MYTYKDKDKQMNVFFNPSDKRIYLTKGLPNIAPLPSGLDVTVNNSNSIEKISRYDEATNKYILSDLGDSYPLEATDFRLNPELVKTKYNSETNTITFMPKVSNGGKSARKTKRKINKKRKTMNRR